MGFIGIRSLSILLSIVSILLTLFITGFLAIQSGESALDSTKKTADDGLTSTRALMDRGLAACFDSGAQNAEFLGGEMMRKVLDEVGAKLQGFVQKPLLIADQLLGLLDSRGADVYHDWMSSTYAPLMMNTLMASTPMGVNEIITFVMPAGQLEVWTYLESPQTVNLPWPDGLGRGRHHAGINADWAPKYDGIENNHIMTVLKNVDHGCSRSITSKAECQRERDVPAKKCVWCDVDVNYVNPDVDVNSTVPYQPDYPAGYCAYKKVCDDGYIPDLAAYGDPDAVEHQRWWISQATRDGSLDPDPHLADGTPRPAAKPNTAKFGGSTVYSLSRMLFDPTRARKLLWSPVFAIGPLLGMKVLASYTATRPMPWIEAPELVGQEKVVGFLTVSLDVKAVNRFVKKAGETLPPGSRIYMVQRNPWLNDHGNSNEGCHDNQHNLSPLIAGLPCVVLKAMVGCDGDIASITDGKLQPGIWMKDNCPETCDSCPPHGGVGTLVGATHGATEWALPLHLSLYGSPEDGELPDLFPRLATNSSDPVIRGHALYSMAQPDYYETFDETALHKWRLMPDSSGGDSWWVPPIEFPEEERAAPPPDVADPDALPGENGTLYWFRRALTSDNQGLYMHTVLLIKRDEAMKLIDTATREVQADIRDVKKRVADDIQQSEKETEEQQDKDRMMMFIYIGISTLVLLIVSVTFVHNIIRPLLILEGEMAEVATMKLESVDDERPLSILSEVAKMQKSFLQMVKNLIEYRNYMPASILCDTDDEEEAGDGGGEPAASAVSTNARERTGNSKPRSSKQSTAKKSVGQQSLAHTVQSRVSMAQNKFKGKTDTLKKKNVSFTILNIRHWHKMMENKPDASVMQAHGDVFAKVLVVCAENKGIPDTFSGDRMLCSFNGVKPCGTHRTMCTSTALKLQTMCPALAAAHAKFFGGKTAESSARTLEVSAAAVSGDPRVGNMGCAGMKRFTFLGSVTTWGYALERLGAQLGAASLIDKAVRDDAKNSFLTRVVDRVQFAKHHKGKAVNVFELCGAKTVGEDEWMYQLEEGEATNPYAAWDKLAAAVLEQQSITDELRAALEPKEGALPLPPVVLERFTAALAGDAASGVTPVGDTSDVAKRSYEPTIITFH